MKITKENAAAYAEHLKTIADGGTIQISDCNNSYRWLDLTLPIHFSLPPNRYRRKPNPKVAWKRNVPYHSSLRSWLTNSEYESNSEYQGKYDKYVQELNTETEAHKTPKNKHKHRFMFFGDQKKRRCADCNKFE